MSGNPTRLARSYDSFEIICYCWLPKSAGTVKDIAKR